MIFLNGNAQLIGAAAASRTHRAGWVCRSNHGSVLDSGGTEWWLWGWCVGFPPLNSPHLTLAHLVCRHCPPRQAPFPTLPHPVTKEKPARLWKLHLFSWATRGLLSDWFTALAGRWVLMLIPKVVNFLWCLWICIQCVLSNLAVQIRQLVLRAKAFVLCVLSPFVGHALSE